jgi:hypothetical protein
LFGEENRKKNFVDKYKKSQLRKSTLKVLCDSSTRRDIDGGLRDIKLRIRIKFGGKNEDCVDSSATFGASAFVFGHLPLDELCQVTILLVLKNSVFCSKVVELFKITF